MNRRTFLKGSTGFAGTVLTGLAINPARTWSRPSHLKIADIRGCTVAANYDYPIIKIYTNQDIYGLGEVRDEMDKSERVRDITDWPTTRGLVEVRDNMGVRSEGLDPQPSDAVGTCQTFSVVRIGP